MSIAKLIEEFCHRRSVPVDVNDVLAALRQRGIKDEVYFFSAAINSEKLRGQFVHWDEAADYEYPTDATQAVYKSVAAVFYAETLTDDWQRLVTCKELLHILDPEQWRAAKEEDVRRLTEKIVLPPEFQDGLRDGMPTVSDRIGILQAVAVLFPWGAREILLKAQATGRVNPTEVAGLVDLPPRYTALVMSDFWPQIHEDLAKIP